jgi:hypothetical protein
MSALANNWARQNWLAGILLLLPLLVTLLHLNTFPYPPQPGAYSDLAVTHYPNAYFLQHELFEERIVPLWSPAILSGYPFAADPLSGLMYPPGWIALLLPLPAGLNLLGVLHLIWGGLGMLFLLRAEGVEYPAALFGGLAFELMPKAVAHAGAGHLTLLYALAWTPWLLWVWRVNYATALGQGNRRQRKWLQPGMLLALIFLADVRWAVYAGILWWAYALAHSHDWRTTSGRLLVQSGLAAMLAAPLALPLLEYTLRSTRGSMTAADILAYSLPLTRLLGLIFPDFRGFHEWMLYPGAAVLCLSLAVLFDREARRGKAFWLWVAAISLLISLGSFVPGANYLARLPGLSLLRVPARALFLTGFAMSILAAWGIEAIQNGLTPTGGRRLRLVLIGLAGFAIVLAIGVGVMTGKLPLPFSWGTGAVCVSVAWLAWGTRGGTIKRTSLWVAGLFLIALLDWGAIDRSLIVFRPAEQVLNEGVDAARWLASQEGTFRVYSPSYSIPQQTAARFGLQLADGVDPLQLERYAAFMEEATGVPRRGYSVTMPPFADGDPMTSNASYTPDPAALGLLNVRYVASAFDLSVKGLTFRAEFDGIRLYENMQALPRAWVQPENVPSGQQAMPAHVIDWQPNRITVEATGPGLLYLSEIAYPGWRAYVDGRRADLPVTGLLRRLSIGPGTKRIDFIFKPASVYIGLVLCIVGLILSVFLAPMQSRGRL